MEDVTMQIAPTQRPTIFDDWPKPSPDDKHSDEDFAQGMTELKKLRLQMLLAVNPWGVPSLAFGDAYERMFGRQIDYKLLGYKHLSEMVSSLPEVFSVQKPNELTAILFPDYPEDIILHDARLGIDFDHPNMDISFETGSQDPNVLIKHAWLNRDEEFPPDVVLAGEEYLELFLPMPSAIIPGTRGLHKALIVGAANPKRFHINIKSESFSKIDNLSSEVSFYFQNCGLPVEAYNVPEEFIYRGFPCLLYQTKQNYWERVSIIGRAVKSSKIIVKTVDYGEELAVDIIYLYLMPRQFLCIPVQGIAVSMIGLRPKNGAKTWNADAGRRLRCFSNRDYWIDCLLIERKKVEVEEVAVNIDKLSLADHDANSSSKAKAKARKERAKQVDFEVILCDRNDEDYNIYIDEILSLETYADCDPSRSQELAELRQKMENAMVKVPRPVNPLKFE